jgi:hypothetical protein
MPTKHPRIAIVNDYELQAALERARPLVGPATRPARLVRDLAIRGADAVVAEHAARQEGIARIVDWTTRGEPPWDPETLARVDELAWGQHGES